MSLVPRLRFKEFSDAWVEKRLEEVGDIVGGGTPDTENDLYWNGEILWITPSEIKGKYIKNSKRTITELGLKNSSTKVLPKGSLLLTSRATIGEVSITLKECTTNQGFQSIVINQANSNEFVYAWIQCNKAKFIKKASGSTFLEISKKEISKIPIHIPSLAEQEQIASFLGVIDDKIDLLQKKENLLKKYKQGVLQKIFNQEIRFKQDDGSEFPAWEEKKLGKVASIITGSTPSTSNIAFYGGNYMFVSPIDIQQNRYIYSTQKKVTKLGLDEGRLLEKNSICLVCIGSIGKIAQLKDIAICNQQINNVKANSDNLDDFIFSLLEYKQNFLKTRANHSVLPILKKSFLEELEFDFPCKAEQQEIANFLTAIDEKIDITTKQLEKTRQYKTALLQQLFI